MESMNEFEWEPTTIKDHRWLNENREDLGDFIDARKRWFVPRGKMWPLLLVTVYTHYPMRPRGVRVVFSYKENDGAWFVDCSLPRKLVPVLIELLGQINVAAPVNEENRK